MKQVARVAGFSMCCVLLLSGGCRRFGTQKAGFDDGEMLGPHQFEDFDMPLGARTEFGQQVMGLDFAPVQFSYDRFQVADAERAKIEAAAAYLRVNPALTLVIEGHCDERGSREYNMALGERRALAVRAYLIGLGIPAERIQTVSYGIDKPADPGRNEQAWARNRRAEFVFYK